jgi:hypothetical protein
MASHAFCEYILQASPRMHRIARDPIRPTPPHPCSSAPITSSLTEVAEDLPRRCPDPRSGHGSRLVPGDASLSKTAGGSLDTQRYPTPGKTAGSGSLIRPV